MKCPTCQSTERDIRQRIATQNEYETVLCEDRWHGLSDASSPEGAATFDGLIALHESYRQALAAGDSDRIAAANDAIWSWVKSALSRPQAPTDQPEAAPRCRSCASLLVCENAENRLWRCPKCGDSCRIRVQAPTDQRIAEIQRAVQLNRNMLMSKVQSGGRMSRTQLHTVSDLLADCTDSLTLLQQRVDELQWSLTAAEKRATEAEQRLGQLDGELRSIDSVMARRPALDQPTRWQNIEKAISMAAKADEAIRLRATAEQRLEAAEHRIDELETDVTNYQNANDALTQQKEAAERELSILRGTVSQDAATIAQLIREKEAAERERDHWKERTRLCSQTLEAAEATVASLTSALKQANALTLMLQEGDDGIHRPDRDFGQRTLHQLKCVLHAALYLPSSSVRTAETDEPYDKGRK